MLSYLFTPMLFIPGNATSYSEFGDFGDMNTEEQFSDFKQLSVMSTCKKVFYGLYIMC